MPAERRLAALAGRVVIDASVAVEYLVAISLTEHAQALFRTVVERDVELWAPDLIYPETVSALRRLARLRAIGAAAAEAAVNHLGRLPLVAVGTKSLMTRSWQLRDAVTPYDACYAVLAESVEALFVTADRRLARTLALLGIQAVFLSDLA